MNTKEKIKKARIQLQLKNPFFSYLSLFLKFQKVEKGKMLCDSMGVDLEGNVFYVDEFVESLSDEELIGVIAHEIGHLVFLTELREGGRDRTGWNLATDIAINSLLNRNNFKLPKGVLIPSYNDEIEIGKIKIKECSKKIAEEIFEELPKVKENETSYMFGDGDEEGKEISKKFDEHLKGKDLTPKEKKDLQKAWSDRTQEAITTARMKGDLPIGVERLIGKLHKETINWKGLLNRFITQQIPYDYSYARCSKKSISVGAYMPHILKEKIDISIMVDLSGSVGGEELADFLSEIIGIARAYQDKIDMRIFSHDTECYDNGLIINGNIEKIKQMKLKGGGGTSFTEPIKYLEENRVNPKCLIWLTDGYGDKVEKQKYPILWVLSKGGSDELIKSSGEVIKLKN